MRRIIVVGMMLFFLVGSFFITLWLSDIYTGESLSDGRSDGERLASQNILDSASLIKAATAAGLHSSTHMKGEIDAISRFNEWVGMVGWLADPGGNGTPRTILFFGAGKNIATTQTQGERPDVTEALGLASGAKQNVGFQVLFQCRTGDPLVVVGLGPNKEFYHFPLSSPQCP